MFNVSSVIAIDPRFRQKVTIHFSLVSEFGICDPPPQPSPGAPTYAPQPPSSHKPHPHLTKSNQTWCPNSKPIASSNRSSRPPPYPKALAHLKIRCSLRRFFGFRIKQGFADDSEKSSCLERAKAKQGGLCRFRRVVVCRGGSVPGLSCASSNAATLCRSPHSPARSCSFPDVCCASAIDALALLFTIM